MVGATLGHYRIIEKIGAGGMGEVYRATDARLGREVAIKLLPEAFARDPERLARFDQEARLLAALNHPNIAAIYGLEEAQDAGPGRTGSGREGLGQAGERIQFLVLELVPGETLAERIGRGAIPVEEALGLCRQIAEALEAAHERGIIHRDLKPANVKVTPGGKVKVLDFGLAKAFAPEGPAAVRAVSPSPGEPLSQSPTVTYGATREGVILGTAPYMSPEQARGKPLDKRTDIWSFGCVLYEALTGRQAFQGETVSDTIARILEREPDWKALPETTPEKLRDLLRRCLHKDSHRRLHDIADARIEIDEALGGQVGRAGTTSASLAAASQVTRRRKLLWSLAGLMVGAITAGVAMWNLKPSPSAQPQSVRRLVIDLPEAEPLAVASSAPLGVGRPSIAISPDGSHLVYVAVHNGTSKLYLRSMDQFEAKPIPGTEGAFNPFFSPDGRWVAFFTGDKLKKVSLGGGEPITLCESRNPFGASWGPDNEIVVADREASSLVQVSADGSTPQPVAAAEAVKGMNQSLWPEILPGGKAVLVTAWAGGTASDESARIEIRSLETGEQRVLVEGGTSARYAPTGHLVYARAGSLLAAPFDLTRLEVTGPEVMVLQGVRVELYGAAQFAFSRDGSLVYVPGAAAEASSTLVWVDRQGRSQLLGTPARNYGTFRLSPDGERLAILILEVTADVWVYELARGTFTRLTLEGNSFGTVWTPDGKRLAFYSERGGGSSLLLKNADGSGETEVLLKVGQDWTPTSWSSDGKVLAFTPIDPTTGPDIWELPLEGDRKPRPLVYTPFTEWGAEFSPDGHWLAYTSDESGHYEVYVVPYPGPGGKWQISTEGGEEPKWARSGGELFYRNGRKWMAVAIASRPQFAASKPRLLFEGSYRNVPGPSYDVAPDGQRFLLLKESEEQRPPRQLNVVLNWFEELKRRVPAGKR